MKNPNNGRYRIKFDQLHPHRAINYVLNMTMRAHPNRGVTSAKVTGALLASRPFAVVLLILIFGPKNPNKAIMIASMVRCNSMQMGIMLCP